MNQTGTIFDRAVCVAVTFNRLGTKRKVSSSAVETDADRAMIHVAKDILDSDELKEVQGLDGKIRGYIASRALPSLFRSGVWLLPIPLVEEVDKKLEEFRLQREDLTKKFLAVYPDKIEEAKRRLNGLFSPTDYPPIERVAAAFGMSTQYLSFGVPGTLESINKAIFEREKEKAQTKLTEATEEITQVLRLALKDLTDHMVERLAPSQDGKPKVFKNTLVANMKDFLETFKARNITDDEETEQLVEKAKQLLDGVDPQMLRDNTSIRQYVQKGMTDIKAALDTMVVLKPARQISFEDEA